MREKFLLFSIAILLVIFSYALHPVKAAERNLLKQISSTKAATIKESEPNNSREQSNSVLPNQNIDGVLKDNQDVDYYKVDMPYDSQFTIISYLGDESWYDNYYYSEQYSLKLYDQNGKEVATSQFQESYDDDAYDTYYYQVIDTPLKKGVYYLSLQANDEYADFDNQHYTLYQQHAFNPDFSLQSITSSKPSPQIERSTITLQANSQTTGLEYQFSIGNKIVQKFSNQQTYTWKADQPGTYKIKVDARNPNFPYAMVSKEITYKITAYKPDFKINSVTPSSSKPLILGKTFTLSTSASKANLQYRYTVNNKVVKNFNNLSTYNWKPTKEGKYKVKVDVRRAEYPNSFATKTIVYTVKDGKVKISSLKANLSSPRPTNSTIRWTTKASGPELQYKYSAYVNKKWITVKNYSSQNIVNWKPTQAGTYKMKVTVRSKASGKTATKDATFTIFKPSAFSITSFKADAKSPQTTGTGIYFTVKAKGSYLEYRFRVFDGYSWYTAQDYSSSKSYYGTPYSTGKYKVAVDVRQKGTKSVKTKVLTFTIKEAPNYKMNSDYSINYNYGYLTITNYGYENIKVTKIELVNDGKAIYSYSPKDWVNIGRRTDTFYFYPKKKVTKFSYYTSVVVTFTYDGMKHKAYLYR